MRVDELIRLLQAFPPDMLVAHSEVELVWDTISTVTVQTLVALPNGRLREPEEPSEWGCSGRMVVHCTDPGYQAPVSYGPGVPYAVIGS